MNDVFGVELQVSLDDMLHVEQSLGMRQTLLDHFAEIRPTKFRDNVGVITCGEDFTQPQDMAAVPEFLQYLDLTVEQFSIDVILEHLEVNHFNSHALIYIEEEVPVSSCRPR